MNKHIQDKPTDPLGEFIYSGQPHQSVPRALFFDRRLTPLERNAWQVIHLLMNHEHPKLTAGYKQLQPFLTSVPCVKMSEKASTETVAKALTILRLTRWVTLAYRKRDRNGCMQGNLYILHEEPLSIFENIQLDAEYFALVCSSLNHANKAVRTVAAKILEEIAQDADLAGRRLPTKIERLIQSIEQNFMDENLSTEPQSEGRQMNLLRMGETPASDSEVGVKPAKNHCLPNPKPDVRNVCSNYKNTIQRMPKIEDVFEELLLPPAFKQISPNRQKQVMSSMSHLAIDMQQKVLDEWAVRCSRAAVRKPVAYLFGIIQKAYQGELNAFCEREGEENNQDSTIKVKVQAAAPEDSSSSTSDAPTEEEKIRRDEAIQKLKALANRLRVR